LILNFNGNWTRNATFRATPASADPPNCPGLYSANCGIALGQIQPKYSFNQRTTLAFKHVDVSLLWRFIGKNKYEPGLPVICDIDNPPFDPDDEENPNNNPEGCTGFIRGVGPQVGDEAQFMSIPAFHYFDLTTRWSVTDHFDLTLAVYNLFDKDAPIVGATAGTAFANSGNTYPSTYDTIGRRYAATVRLKF
jgi:outer membrane receptor protein involved in Fe transport